MYLEKSHLYTLLVNACMCLKKFRIPSGLKMVSMKLHLLHVVSVHCFKKWEEEYFEAIRQTSGLLCFSGFFSSQNDLTQHS